MELRAIPPQDPFDPDDPPPHWVDEDGNFGGWMSEASVATLTLQEDDETLPDQEFADRLAADGDEFEF